MSLEVHYLNGGYCRQLLGTVDGRSIRLVRFHAVFLAIRHPRLGWIVCDAGYGNRFIEATRRWPYRLYRWATPVTLRGSAASALARINLSPADVQHLLITHFHADHIGGLAEFCNARVFYRHDALEPLLALSPLRQTRAAFLPSLVPADLASRCSVIPASSFRNEDGLPFPVCDLFGDGMVKLVSLPGHAPGQIGLEFHDQGIRTLYCADAFWRWVQIEAAVDLPRPILALQWDRVAYRTTIATLRALAEKRTHRLLACHDEETQRYVTA